MDHELQRFYDLKGATELLESLAEERMNGRQGNRQVAAYAKTPGPDMYTTETPEPKGIRLAVKDLNDGQLEEAVLRVQGIICRSHLPPKRKLLRGEPDTVRYMQQAFTLTGCDSAQFNTAIEGAFSIAEFLALQQSDMEVWKPKQLGSDLTIDISNRLFVRQNRDNEHKPVAMDRSVDPHGTLQKVANGEYVHTEDCVVRYFIRSENEDGTISYNKAESSIFNMGDIVEAQCSFIAIPTRKGPYHMKIILRALTMLNSEFSKAARLAQWKYIVASPRVADSNTQKVVHRRNVGYDGDAENEDEIEIVNKKVKSMQVDAA
ncbi:hypothetical protein HWV62_24456 [Athelia sp. TMB]|nr:hypothetical protein HWV62_24456 [Athelia sp. TMB]